MRPFRAAGVLLLAAVLGLASTAPSPADAFSEELLEGGLRAVARGDAEYAAKILRLACFGLLEEPRKLGHCLVRLALVEARLEDREGFRRTIDRLVEVEERFRGYSTATVPIDVLTRFENVVESQLGAEAPALAVLDRVAAPVAVTPGEGEGRLAVRFEALAGTGRVRVHVDGTLVLERDFDAASSPVRILQNVSLPVGAVDLRVEVELADGRRQANELSGNLSPAIERTLHVIVPRSVATTSDEVSEVRFE